MTATLSPTAQAAPTPTPPPTASTQGSPGDGPRVSRVTYLSPETKAEIELDFRITYTSVNRTTKRMDYARAIKYNPGKRTNVRIFAAGFLFGGGKLTGISPTETAKVRSYIPSIGSQTGAPKGLSASGIDCRGRHGYVPLTGTDTMFWGQRTPTKWNYYFTSCETILLMSAAALTSATAGVIAALSGPAAPAMALLAWVIALGGIYITALYELSDVNATGVASRYSLVYGIAQ